jgi:radical SAM family uncharacterized protein/radical SAM-linked protein
MWVDAVRPGLTNDIGTAIPLMDVPMPRIDQTTLEGLLSGVQKPGRYIGRELNAVVRESARLRMALSYPDLYEVGMSNNGLRILYDIVNAIPGAACERVFAAADDFERALRGASVPLFTLETRTPLGELDLLGFNVSHEMLCTNILQILDLGGIPLRRADRTGGNPVIIAGGEAVSNPFPLSDFIDAFYLGDGEEGIREIVAAAMAAREAGEGRGGMIERIGSVEGVLLPSRYTEGAGPAVRKRVYRGAELADPARPLVPNIRIAQERVVIEVTRGCSNFCSFCHAGFYDLPYRCYDYRAAAGRVLDIVKNTGYNEVTLSSLSISDYPGLAGLINAALPELTGMGVSVSFPSLRVDTATLPLLEQISEVRRASLTFAVESASEQIRAMANKKVFTGDLLEIVSHVRSRGWKVIKLYFMIGLPGCDGHDEAGDIIGLLKEIHRAAGRGMDINVTVSPFVPKPHTPFQRERQMGLDYLEKTVRRIKQGLPRHIKIKNHDVRASIMEGVLARGDARLGRVIERVYGSGSRFDSWEEHFRYDAWKAALDEDIPGWEQSLEGPGTGALPWRFVETGFERLVEKRREAIAAGGPLRERKPQRREEIDADRLSEARLRFAARYAVRGSARLRFTKTGLMKYVPHNDFMEIVKRALRMADAPVAMTQGFNKRERMSAGYPLPLGLESEAELVDVDLFGGMAPGFIDAMNARLPDGITLAGARPLEGGASIMADTAVTGYLVAGISGGQCETMAANLSSGIEFTRRTRKDERRVPFVSVIHSYELPGGESFLLRLVTGTEDSVRIDEVVRDLAGTDIHTIQGLRIIKTAQYRLVDGALEMIT